MSYPPIGVPLKNLLYDCFSKELVQQIMSAWPSGPFLSHPKTIVRLKNGTEYRGLRISAASHVEGVWYLKLNENDDRSGPPSIPIGDIESVKIEG